MLAGLVLGMASVEVVCLCVTTGLTFLLGKPPTSNEWAVM